ncbi:MAG: adenylate/guanylate cyclase domain-containing protein [Pseudonocardia sp.]|nr:adenylate/guanylate cyclase domain-containing protein [Pseudonocardia sp.]MBO0877892.1 adenylate/guanylate cyclase domain-containing protein [Pseudonocardia sp.]
MAKREGSGKRRTVIDWPARLLLSVVMITANVAGTVGTVGFAVWALPKGPLPDPDRVLLLNVALVAGYLVLVVPLSLLWIALRFRARVDDANQERQLVLHGPLHVSQVLVVTWGLATALFGAANATFSLRLGLAMAETWLVGGITTCALCYLLAERILRRAASQVLAGNPPRPRFKASVLLRPVMFWLLGTAVPVSGLLVAAGGALIYRDVPAEQLAVLMLAGGGVALLMGFLTTVGAARAVADPVRTVRLALQQVERGDLDVSVPVYDATELGQLQAGFNTMAGGLRERERISDLFGRHVGRDVARAATATDEVQLGGEVRTVAILFVDLVGSTPLAAERPPTEVVALLNRFFGVVVEVVESCGGWINKFEGDAALAVFGAPEDIDDPAGRALAAARELAVRLSTAVPDVFAGIGVSAGDAVAGYVGGVRRYEYTVIGDPVNEAARLTELAKTVPGLVLAGINAVRLAGKAEARRWVAGDAVTLRGRNTPTRLASPLPWDDRHDAAGSTWRDPEGATAS